MVPLFSALVVMALACSVSSPEPQASSTEPTSVPPDVGAAQAPAPLAPYTPDQRPPRVNTSIASVPLDEIVFNTVSVLGEWVSLAHLSPSIIEQVRDSIKPIYEPKYEDVEGGDWLSDEDLVIGYSSPSGAYAYPVRILNFHEIVNDVVDGLPVLVTYCPLCASGVVYGRRVDGRILLFGNTHALHQSDTVMYDHQTGSYWYQVLGEAIVGPLTGQRLKLLPSVTITWAQWKEQHPKSRVLSRDQGLLSTVDGDPYADDPFAGYDQSINRGQFETPVSPKVVDDRLRPGDRALVVEVGGTSKAYALLSASDWLVSDLVGGKSVLVIGTAKGPAAAAYYSSVDGRPLTFRLGEDSIEDLETGSVWDFSGLALSGPLKGTRLAPVPSRTGFWFSLAGALPGIELYVPE